MPFELLGMGVAARPSSRRPWPRDCRNLTPCRLARQLSPLIAACSSLASVGKLMAFGCTVVSTVTRLRSWLRNARPRAPPRRLSASSSSSLSPSRLRQWLRSERSCGSGVLEKLTQNRFTVCILQGDTASRQRRVLLRLDAFERLRCLGNRCGIRT